MNADELRGIQSGFECIHGCPHHVGLFSGMKRHVVSSRLDPVDIGPFDTDQRQALMPFVGKYVRASGIVFERTGTHAIVITEINEMKEVRVKDEE
jgi:hypothetical protein